MQAIEFVKGERYTNRRGSYTVLDLRPPDMRVRYDDGQEETLSILTQQRILSNMTLPPRTPEPPPRRKSFTTPAAKVPRVSAPAGAVDGPEAAPSPAPRKTGPATRVRRTTGSAATLTSTFAQIAAMTGKEQHRARLDALAAVLVTPAAFQALADRSRESERGRLQVLSLSAITRLRANDPAPTRQQPEEFLPYAIATNRAYLAADGQDILAWRYPLYEAGSERYLIDLLCYDTAARRAMLVCAITKTTLRRWLWEALLDSLRNWAAVSATAGFASSLDEYVIDAAPSLVVLGPPSFWADNAPGAGAHVAEVTAGHAMNRRLLTAVESWLRIPTLLLQIPDDWLRTADELDQPRISVAAFPRGGV